MKRGKSPARGCSSPGGQGWALPLCGHCLPVHRPETQHVLKQLLGKADSHRTQQKGLPRHGGGGEASHRPESEEARTEGAGCLEKKGK